MKDASLRQHKANDGGMTARAVAWEPLYQLEGRLMAGKDKLLKANAFVMGSRINLELRRIADELGRSLLTADLAVDVRACCTDLLLKLEALAGCKPNELWTVEGVPTLVYETELAEVTNNVEAQRKAYQGVHTVRGRRKGKATEGGAA